jgi:hypothetical protein
MASAFRSVSDIDRPAPEGGPEASYCYPSRACLMKTVGRVVLVTSTIPAGEGSERQELMIVPWPMRDFDFSGPESPARREVGGASRREVEH